MHDVARLEEVARTSFDHRLYDGNLSGGMPDRWAGPIVLKLYRVVP
jgi:hypothetical protein